MLDQWHNMKRFVGRMVLFFGNFVWMLPAQAQSRFGLEYGEDVFLGERDVRETIFQIVNIVLGIVGIIFLGLVMYGGYLWMTSSDEPEKQNRAKGTIRNAVIGLLIIFAAFGITQFILSRLGESTGAFESCKPGVDTSSECTLGTCVGIRYCDQVTSVWGSCQIDSDCDPSLTIFRLEDNEPRDGDNNVIRNVGFWFRFNQEVESESLKNHVHLVPVDAGGIEGEEVALSEFSVNKKNVEFRPSSSLSCFNSDGVQIYDPVSGEPITGCLEANTQYRLKLDAEIISRSGHNLDCSFGNLCVINFTAGEVVDLYFPEVTIINPGGVCTDNLVPLSFKATDDSGIKYFDVALEVYEENSPTPFDTETFQIGGQNIYCTGIPGEKNSVLCTGELNFDSSWLVDASSYILKIRATAKDLDDHISNESSIQVPLRPNFCCNETQDIDQGETGIDCGGVCGLCEGANCNSDAGATAGICEPQNQVCSSNKCDSTGCLCISPPIIDAISPEKNGTPVGAEGNLITLWGRNFGKNPGKVFFLGNNRFDSSDDVEAIPPEEVNPLCDDRSWWNNTQIIVGIPFGKGAASGPIEVRNETNLVDRTDDDYGVAIPDIVIDPSNELPGICLLTPANGEFGDRFSIDGINLGTGTTIISDHRVVFGEDTTASLSDSASWREEQVDEKTVGIIEDVLVPNVVDQVHTVTVIDGGERSNGLLFTVGISGKLPFISEVDPSSGGSEQYITIKGGRFGSRPGTVWFRDNSFESLATGLTNFPSQCLSVWWRDDQIIVKVPEKYQGGENVHFGDYALYVETQDGLGSNEKNFQVTDDSPGPGLCALRPENGVEGDALYLYGEFFGDKAEGYDGVFYWQNLRESAHATWNETEIGQSIVPAGVQSGPVRVAKDTLGATTKTECETDGYLWDREASAGAGKCLLPSNTLNFEIGLCQSNNDCSDGISVCCFNGIYENHCVPESICGATYPQCSFSWSFSTFRSDVCEGANCVNPPTVVKDDSCTDGSLSSPSPKEDDMNACINAGVTARFSEEVEHVEENVVVERCGNDPSTYGNCTVTIPGSVSVAMTSIKEEFFVFYPEENFVPGYWYRASLKDGITDLDKVPLDGNGDGVPGGNFVWYFWMSPGEDGTGYQCQFDNVAIDPAFKLFNEKYDTENFLASAYNSACYVIQPTDQYNWLIKNTSVATITESPLPYEVLVESRSEGDTTLEAAIELKDEKGKTTGTFIRSDADISVRFADLQVTDYWPSCQSACVNAALGGEMSLDIKKESLQVSFLSKNATSQEKNQAAGDSVMLYECQENDSACSSKNLKRLNLLSSGGGIEDSAVFYERELPGGGSDTLESHYKVKIDSSKIFDENGSIYNRDANGKSRLLSDRWYRVFFGKNIEAWNGEKLSNLNFSLGTGEDCDDKNTTNEDGCSSQCLHEGEDPLQKTCGNGTIDTGEDCDDANRFEGDGCNSSCTHEGSKYISQCGDGPTNSADDNIVQVSYEIYDQSGQAPLDAGEDCDPSVEPWKTYGGCTDACVLTGSSPIAQKEPICGNGKVEPGEQCDPKKDPWLSKGNCNESTCLLEGTVSVSQGGTCGNGKVDFGETCDTGVYPWDEFGGCRDNCLNTGSTSAVCGNGKREVGEDCDDGNTTNGDGCSEICLHEGSFGAAVCGDGIIDGAELDGFSWVFKVGDNPEMCELNAIHIAPENYTSSFIGEKPEFFIEALSKPDECRRDGQILNASSYDWDWDPRDALDNEEGRLRELSAFRGSTPLIDESVAGIDKEDFVKWDLQQNFVVRGDQVLDSNNTQQTLIAGALRTSPGQFKELCVEEGNSCGSLTLQCGFSEDSECKNACDKTRPHESGKSGTCLSNEALGCDTDIECVGVATSSCCSARPTVKSCSPTKDTNASDGILCESGAQEVCRNALIEIVLDQRLDQDSVLGQITVEKISGACAELADNSQGIFSKIFAFFRRMLGRYAIAQEKSSTSSSCFVRGSSLSYPNAEGTTTIAFSPSSYLDSRSTYQVSVHGDTNLSDATKLGIRNVDGVAMNGDYNFTFTSGDDVCSIDYVEVQVIRRDELGEPLGRFTTDDLFQCSGDDCQEDYDTRVSYPATQHYYVAQARDITGVGIAQAEYSWNLSSNPEEILDISSPTNPLPDGGPPLPENQGTYVTLKNPLQDEEGIIQVVAEAVDGSEEVGKASQEINVRIFLCNNPWPSFESFPFRDAKNNCTVYGEGETCSNFNFEMYYCRDAGDASSKLDDLPALVSNTATSTNLANNPLQFTCKVDGIAKNETTIDDRDCVATLASDAFTEDDNKLKEFLFLREDISSDGIGLRIYENSSGYSPLRWYNQNVPNPGDPGTEIIDGYESLSDGRSTYIASSNLAFNESDSKNYLYTNIYLLSHDQNATNESKEIYSQLKKYFKINTNVEDINICSYVGLDGTNIVEKWRWAPEDGEYTDVMSTPTIADLDPTDDNNTPQVIVNAFDYQKPCTWQCDGQVRVLDGDSGKEVSFFDKYDITDARLKTYGRSQMAVGNIDADQELEIVVAGSNYCPTTDGSVPTQVCSASTAPAVCASGIQCVLGGIFALNHDGSVLWWVPWKSIGGQVMNEVLSIYDFDQDGRPEVQSGSYILDGATGEEIGSFSSGSKIYPIVVDIDNDGKNEFIAGSVVYEINGRGTSSFFTEKYRVSGWEESSAGISDFNNDGNPDLLLVKNTTTEIGVFELKSGSPQTFWSQTYDIGLCVDGSNTKEESICDVDSDCTAYGSGFKCDSQYSGKPGAPVIADFDGDGGVDIGVKGKNAYVAINGDNGDLLWDYRRDRDDSEYSDNSSSSNSAFDFNNDGAFEITQRNSNNFYIFDGKGNNGRGTVLFKNNNHSSTLYELAPIVDVDNDGHADIVVPTNDNGSGTYKNTGIVVFESATDSWPATRTIWNQDNYFIDNVCDGTEGIAGCKYGDIPAVPLKPWEHNNSLRSNLVLGDASSTPSTFCERDDQCFAGSVCLSNKSKLIRDTKRLADIHEMQIIADSYNNQNGTYPTLESGTYIKGSSFSVWPSWQETLPQYFGALPTDPINKFYGCVDPANSDTCWDETNLKFSCPRTAYVYAYQTLSDGDLGKFYTNFEYAGAYPGTFQGTLPQCNDGIDNDSDGKIDWNGAAIGAPDPGCKSGEVDDSEEDAALDIGACLNYFGIVSNDWDADGVPDKSDNCIYVSNGFQEDTDQDQAGDVCDICLLDKENDQDKDAVCETTGTSGYGSNDNCQSVYNPDQSDHDSDGIGDACDKGSCSGDADGDGFCDELDNCLAKFNSDQTDSNGNGIGDACDTCSGDAVDNDKDGVCGEVDITFLSCTEPYKNTLSASYTLKDNDSFLLNFPGCSSLTGVSGSVTYQNFSQETYLTISLDISSEMGLDNIRSAISMLDPTSGLIDKLWFENSEMAIRFVAWDNAVIVDTGYITNEGNYGALTLGGTLLNLLQSLEENGLRSGQNLVTGLKTSLEPAMSIPEGSSLATLYLTNLGDATTYNDLEYGDSLSELSGEAKTKGQKIYTFLYGHPDDLKSSGMKLLKEESMCIFSSNYSPTDTHYSSYNLLNLNDYCLETYGLLAGANNKKYASSLVTDQYLTITIDVSSEMGSSHVNDVVDLLTREDGILDKIWFENPQVAVRVIGWNNGIVKDTEQYSSPAKEGIAGELYVKFALIDLTKLVGQTPQLALGLQSAFDGLIASGVPSSVKHKIFYISNFGIVSSADTDESWDQVYNQAKNIKSFENDIYVWQYSHAGDTSIETFAKDELACVLSSNFDWNNTYYDFYSPLVPSDFGSGECMKSFGKNAGSKDRGFTSTSNVLAPEDFLIDEEPWSNINIVNDLAYSFDPKFSGSNLNLCANENCFQTDINESLQNSYERGAKENILFNITSVTQDPLNPPTASAVADVVCGNQNEHETSVALNMNEDGQALVSDMTFEYCPYYEIGAAGTGDNCPNAYNPSQVDSDGDGIGDVCDICHDPDFDYVGSAGFDNSGCIAKDKFDNCSTKTNPDQVDSDTDGIGDACDEQTCGNGKVEVSEVCDFGAYNVLSGITYAIQSVVGPNLPSQNSQEAQLDNSAYYDPYLDGRVFDPAGVNLSSQTNQYQCNSQCLWTGGYCGDGVVQKDFGEQCELSGSGSGPDDQYACSDACLWTGGYCGDNEWENQTKYGEQCDLGADGGIYSGGGTSYFNPLGCFGLELSSTETRTRGKQSCTYIYSKDDFDPSRYPLCGDGTVSGGEQCDTQGGSGRKEDDQYGCDSDECIFIGGWCGNKVIDYRSTAEFGGYESCDEGEYGGTITDGGISENYQYLCHGSFEFTGGDPLPIDTGLMCTSYGGYCGDNTVQSEYGEQCDKGASFGSTDVDVVFTIDTSDSMVDEMAALCSAIGEVETWNDAQNGSGSIQFRVYAQGIKDSFGALTVGLFLNSCLTTDGGLHNGILSNNSGIPYRTVYGSQPGIVTDFYEDMIPSAQDVINYESSWRQGATKLVIPISDEPPQNGHIWCDDQGISCSCLDSNNENEDACQILGYDSSDQEALNSATTAAKNQGVIISPIYGVDMQYIFRPAYHEDEVEKAVEGIGGILKAYDKNSTVESDELADMIKNIVNAALCDGDGDKIMDCRISN